MERVERCKNFLVISLVVSAALLSTTCDNPVDLLEEVTIEAMKANDRYLEIDDISAALMKDSTLVSPSAKVVVTFDREIDPASLGNLALFEKTNPGDDWTSINVLASVSGRVLKVSRDPYFDTEKYYSLKVQGLHGTDGSALLEAGSWEFETGIAPAGSLVLSNPGSQTGYTNDTTVTANISVNSISSAYLISESPITEPYPAIGWTSISNSATPDFVISSGEAQKTVYVLLKDSHPTTPTYSVVIMGSVYMDTVVPSASAVSVTYSGSDAAYVKGTQTVTGTGSDAVGLHKMEFYINGALVTTDDASPYSYSWDTSGYTNGTSYPVYCKAYDFAGNILDSTTLDRTVDNALPSSSVSINYAGFDAAYVNGTRTVSATASDAVALAKVDYYIGGELKATTMSPPHTYSWNTTSGYTNGNSYAVYCRATDKAGNYKDSVVLDRTVDNVVPAVSSFSISGTGDGTNAYINTTSTTLNNSVTDSSALQMHFSNVDAGYSTYETFAATKVWTLAAGEGTKYVYYQFRDAAGNATTTGTAARDDIILDTTVPAVTITTPASGAAVADTTLNTYADASDASAVWKVEFLTDGISKGTDTASAYISPQYVDTSSMTEGSTHSAAATAYDRAGNSATDTNTFTIDNYAFSTVTLPDVGSDSSAFGSENAIAADRTFDNIYVAYLDIAQDEIQMLRSGNLGSSWNTTAADIAAKGRKPALAVDYSGVIHALYLGGSTLYYRRSTDLGNSWSAAAVLATDASGLYTPAISLYGTTTIYVHVAYITSATAPYTLKYRFSLNGGASFGTAATIASTTSQIRYPKMAFNTAGTYITWQDYANRRLYIAARNNTTGAALVAATVVGPADVGEFPSIAALTYNDKLGTTRNSVLITCADGVSGGAFRYVCTTNGGSTWSDGSVAPLMSSVQSDTTANAIGLVSNLSDVYHTAYYDDASNNLVLGKSYDMMTWYSYTVDGSTNDVGSAPGIASDGVTSYISYYDATATRLKFAIAQIKF